MTAESERLAAELRAIGADAAVLARAEEVYYATGFEVPPPIDPAMVFSVEPGVYGGDLRTGARCERVMLVREDGPEILSQFRWGMEV